MVQISLDEMPLQNLVLEPEKRVTKGDGLSTEPLVERLALGGPQIIPITADRAGDDEKLRYFIENEGSKFHLIHMNCNFNPRENETFNSARVWIKLQRTDQVSEPQPVAWSMQPHRLATAVKYTSTVNLGANAKFFEVIGVESGAEHSTEIEKKEIFLQAFNEMTDNPYWQFKETKAERIYGSHHLNLIIQHPAETTIGGTVNIIADLERKKFRILSFKVPIENTPSLKFQLV
jgi:hypothetical protein